MKNSAQYAWWLLILLFSLVIVANVSLFWYLFFTPSSTSLSAANQRVAVDFLSRYLLLMRSLGVGTSAREATLKELNHALDGLYAPYEATLYRALLEAVFETDNPKRTLALLGDLPSEQLTPAQRRWQAMRWQSLFRQPPPTAQLTELLDTLETPSPVARRLAEIALYQRAGDSARASEIRQSLVSRVLLSAIVLGVLFLVVGILGLAGVGLLIWYFVNRPVLPLRPAPDESPFVYDPLLWALVIFLVVMLYLPTVRWWVGNLEGVELLYLVAVLLPLVFLYSLRHSPDALGNLRWFEGSWSKQIGAGFVGFAMYLPVLVGLVWVVTRLMPALPAEQVNPIGERIGGAMSRWEWMWLFVQAAVLAPIVEEFVFRGVLFKVLWQRTGRVWLSAFVSGYLFAVIHPQFLGGILPLTAFGTVAAMLYAHTRSLLPCIVLHALNNGGLMLMLWAYAG